MSLFISDACMGLLESLGEFYPEAQWQRCVVHPYRNVFSLVPSGKMQVGSLMLKAIHAQEDKAAAREKAKQVSAKLHEMKLSKAACWIEEKMAETLTYYDFNSALMLGAARLRHLAGTRWGIKRYLSMARLKEQGLGTQVA